MKDLLIFVPGAMASCLRVSSSGTLSGKKLWYEDQSNSLSQLASNPSLYKWDPHISIEPYSILTHVRVFFIKRDIYGALGKALQSLDNYDYAEFPYDWRQDIRLTAKKLGEWLHSHHSFKIDETGVQSKENQPRLSIIGHSMGGLVAAMALMKGYIHPENISKLITIGTPFYGAPAAFRALFEEGYLPCMHWLNRTINWRRDRRKCKQVLLEAIQSFCGVYQLLPPVSDKYVDLEDGRTINPLTESQIDKNMRDAATETHQELALFHDFLKRYPSIQHHFIYGDYPNNTEKLYMANVSPTGRNYDNLRCYKLTHGDGTVPVTSSSIETSPASKAPVVGATHAFMCADTRVIDLISAYLSATGKSVAIGR
jgi:pimeloyl-ACP methyl ester carboxylesterase